MNLDEPTCLLCKLTDSLCINVVWSEQKLILQFLFEQDFIINT